MTLKVTIYEGAEKAQPQMRLFLKQDGNTVKLCGLTVDNAELTILHIDEDGIRRIGGMSRWTGWPVDESGRLILAGE